jgi:hypothetical protein
MAARGSAKRRGNASRPLWCWCVGSLIVDMLPMVDPKVMLGSIRWSLFDPRLHEVALDSVRTEELV